MTRSFAIALGLAAASLGAQANTITVNGVLDASTVTRDFFGGDFYQGSPFTLAPGDTVRLNLSFLPGQALQLERAVLVGVRVRGDQPTITGTISVMATFADLTGPAHNPVQPNVWSLGGTGGNVDAMVYYTSWQPPGPPPGGYPVGSISFTGVTVEVTILDDTKLSLAGHNFYGIDFWTYAMDSATAITAVPEPTEMLLLSLGLVALTGAVRRRRAA